MRGNLLWLALMLLIGCIVGVLGKAKIDTFSINLGGKEGVQGPKVGGDVVDGDKDTIGGDKAGGDNVGGDNTSGIKTEGDNVGGDQNKDTTVESINIQPGANAQITIQPGDAKYSNDQQPNVTQPTDSSDKPTQVKPVDLSKFKTASIFSSDLLIRDYANFVTFDSDKTVIANVTYPSVFRLQGNTEKRKAVFTLSGSQKAIYLQFGLKDLPEQGDNLMYDVNILVSDQEVKQVWSGKVVYGSKNQIVSLPFEASGAKTLIIEYTVAQGDSQRGLFFTRAELLYE